MIAQIDEVLTAVSLGLTQQRDGYAVLRNEFTVGVTEVVGYCRRPSVAVQAATILTTSVAEPGVRYEAVHGDRAAALQERTW